MAEIKTGSRKGEEVEIHQWANNWVMLEDSKIVAPTSLIYTPAELDKMRNDYNLGLFWDLYEARLYSEKPLLYCLKRRKKVKNENNNQRR